VQAQVASASLDLSQEGPVDAGLMGQGFLAEAEGFPAGADTFAERSGGGGERFGHGPDNDILLDYLCPERLYPMRLHPDIVRPNVCNRRLPPIARRH
jgi:hypothetical protein